MTSSTPLIIQPNANLEEALEKDPFLGYASVEDAQSDCQASSQLEVFCRLMNRESVFVSGVAGSGKSSIVRPFVDYIRKEFPENTVSVVAPTGAAAANIGGSTIHSWAGVITKPDQVLFTNRSALADVDVLVIDEISMVPAFIFEGLDRALQVSKRVWKPFGGIQVILMGDFMQLPPVPDRERDSRFAVFTESWKKLSPKYCFIEKARRASDERLQKILSDITRNDVTDESKALLETRMKAERDESKKYVNLFTTNRKISSYNKQRLEEVPNPSQFYAPQVDYYFSDAKSRKPVDAEVRKLDVKEPVELKEGCAVLLTKNHRFAERLYPNGSIGEVVALYPDTVHVRFNDGQVWPISYYETGVTKMLKETRQVRGKMKEVNTERTVGTVRYLPLKLGYAISVHKSQGQTCDGVVADLENIFTPGLGYVALSRVRNLDDLIISKFSPKAFSVDPASYKITKMVKLASLKSRKEFEEKQEEYTEVLTNSLARIAVWGA